MKPLKDLLPGSLLLFTAQWMVLLGSPSPVSSDVLYNGLVFSAGEWSSPNSGLANFSSDGSLAELSASGASHIRLLVTWYQDYINSTKIYPLTGKTPSRTVSDAELEHAISTARQYGLKVAMAPILDPNWDLPTNLRAYPGYEGAKCILNTSETCPGWPVSRLQIGCAFNSPGKIRRNCTRFSASQWADWFDSYSAFIMHYAVMAERNSVDLFMVGSELDLTFEQGDLWTDIVKRVRGVFKGKLTAAVGMATAMEMTWWGELDYLGTEGYDPLSPVNETVAGFVAAWTPLLQQRDTLVKKWNMSLMFTEHGYQSRPRCWKRPYATIRPYALDCSVWSLCYDVDCQAMAYEAFFQAVSTRSWYIGSFWWLWRNDNSQGGPSDNSFTPRGKPAFKVLRKYFSSSTARTAVPIKTSDVLPESGKEKRDLSNSSVKLPMVQRGDMQRGMVFGAGQWSAPNITLDSTEAFLSMSSCVASTGINTLQFVPTLYFDNTTSTEFYAKDNTSRLRTTTDAELSNAIQFAASLHADIALTVMLEPDYDLAKNYDSQGLYIGQGHQHLGQNFNESELAAWFAAYKKTVVKYATLLNRNGAKTLILGHELNGIISHSESASLFSDVIKAVRDSFNGQVSFTFDGNLVAEQVAGGKVPWIQDLDFIGLSCYWSVPWNDTLIPDSPWVLPPIDVLIDAYRSSVSMLKNLSQTFGNMTVVCTDVGYQSRPYAWNHRLSPIQLDPSDCSVWDQCINAEAQALAYRAFLRAVRGQSWYGGTHWWLWRTDTSAGGTSDDSYTPAMKPAMAVLRGPW